MSEIPIVSNTLPARDLIHDLGSGLDGVRFDLKEEVQGTRGLDPLVVVALINAGSAAITTLINFIVNSKIKKNKGTDIISLKLNGAEISFPKGTPDAELEKYFSLIEQFSNRNRTRLSFDAQTYLNHKSDFDQLLDNIPPEKVKQINIRENL